MLVDKTNYALLGVVGFVALVAIIGMLASSQRGATLSFSGATLTGNVVSAEEDTSRYMRELAQQPERARPSIHPLDYDYDFDGKLSDHDLRLFDAVMRRERFCPTNKVCDINGDGVITDADRLILLRGILGQQAADLVNSKNVVPERAPLPPRTPEFWTGATGVPR